MVQLVRLCVRYVWCVCGKEGVESVDSCGPVCVCANLACLQQSGGGPAEAESADATVR
jgi:hypothetical protein